MTHFTYIGLGSNLHGPEQQIETALAELDGIEHTQLLAWSSLYRTAPLDAPSPQPDYVNAVALLRTELSVDALFDRMQAIETGHGIRGPYRNAPRALDLDLLLVDQLVLSTPRVRLPHPRLHERAFALAPLAEIAPHLYVPGHGAVQALLDALKDDPRQRIARLRAGVPATLATST